VSFFVNLFLNSYLVPQECEELFSKRLIERVNIKRLYSKRQAFCHLYRKLHRPLITYIYSIYLHRSRVNARLLRLFFARISRNTQWSRRGGEQRAAFALRHEGTNDVTLSRLGGHLFRH